MATIVQGTVAQCCGTCGSFQDPDGNGAGLCFDVRHYRKRALNVRDDKVCEFWHRVEREIGKPASLHDRIIAALVFSWGGAPRSCREICDWIDREFSTKVFVADVARAIEHQFTKGRVLQVFDPRDGEAAPAPLDRDDTWVQRYSRILRAEKGKAPILFRVHETAEIAFRELFARYAADHDRVLAARLAAARGDSAPL
jgi:hypothetical protein